MRGKGYGVLMDLLPGLLSTVFGGFVFGLHGLGLQARTVIRRRLRSKHLSVALGIFSLRAGSRECTRDWRYTKHACTRSVT